MKSSSILTLLDALVAPAKPNRFRVEINLPKGIDESLLSFLPDGFVSDEISSNNMNKNNGLLNKDGKMDILCYACNIPMKTISTYDIKQNSNSVRIPYTQNFETVAFSFYTDEHYNSRKFFDIWVDTVINSNNTLNFIEEYKSDIIIYALDERGNDMYGVKLIDAYPISLTPLDFSSNNENNAQTVSATMTYRKFVTVKVNEVNHG